MGPQVHHGRPAARHRHRVTFDLFQNGPFSGLRAKRHACHALAALDLGDGLAGFHADAQCLGLFHQFTAALRARIDHDRHDQSGVFKGNCRKVSIIIVGDDNGAVPDRHAVIDRVIAHGRGQHHTGDVIARKGQRPFDRACGGHDLAGADAPQAVARACRRRIMIAQLFIAQHIAVVIHPCPHATGAQGYIRHCFQFGDSLFNKLIHRHIFDLPAINRRAPAQMRGLFQQHHLGAGQRRRLGRLKPCNPAADHQNIGEGVEMFVGVHIAVFRGLAQTGRLANERFVHVFPERTGIHEHLVIKAGGQKPRQVRVDRTDIEFKAGPVVLAGGFQPVKQFCRGHALVGFERCRPRPC